MPYLKPLNSAQRPTEACGFVDNARALPTSPTGSNNSKRSGHLMCYKTRTSSRATDSGRGLEIVGRYQVFDAGWVNV